MGSKCLLGTDLREGEKFWWLHNNVTQFMQLNSKLKNG